jgi:hypothetical protein
VSFEDQEESRSQGEPVELFKFVYGTTPNAFHAYTNAEKSITHAGVTYEPIPIVRNEIRASGTLDKAALTVRVPINAEIAELFRVYPPGQVVTLIVRQGHANDTAGEFLVAWSGRVLSGKREGSETVFTCEPISTSMRRTGLRQNYQYGCRHALYGPACKASKPAATLEVVSVIVTATRITLNEGWNGSFPVAGFVGGMVEWDTARGREFRSILKIENAGKTLVLTGPTTDFAAGDPLDVVLGCPHDLASCETLHDNVVNFGGFPWIPTENPINKNPFS